MEVSEIAFFFFFLNAFITQRILCPSIFWATFALNSVTLYCTLQYLLKCSSDKHISSKPILNQTFQI